jgi:hypothetical protein
MKRSEPTTSDEMLPEYDFRGGIRGRYLRRYYGADVVLLDPDIAAVFKDSAAVNAALRSLLKSRADEKPT